MKFGALSQSPAGRLPFTSLTSSPSRGTTTRSWASRRRTPVDFYLAALDGQVSLASCVEQASPKPPHASEGRPGHSACPAGARAARREARPRGPSGEEARAAARPSGEDACAASAQRHNRSSAVRRWAHKYSAVSQQSHGSAFSALVALVTGNDLASTEFLVPTCCRRRAALDAWVEA
ncbi:MAG: hypothetical protein ACJA2W_001540 [Planctomycetota bacterium]|jgi:hypothetical protein